MIELLWLGVIAGFAWCLGRTVFASARCKFATWAGNLAAPTALGLGIIVYLVLAVGFAGQLNRAAILAVTTAMALSVIAIEWRRSGLRREVGSLDAPAATIASKIERQPAGRDWKSFAARSGLAIVVATALGGTLIGALAPPTAGDALCYHLEIPKRFVQLGEIRYLPLTDNSTMPFLMEMLYTLALLLRGPELAQILHWLVGVLLALAAIELASPIVGKAASVCAGAIVLLVPGVTNQMAAPLNDLAVALFTTLMVTAWLRWQTTRAAQWLALAGVFGGLGLSTKLIAAGMVAIVGVAVIVESLRTDCHGQRSATLRRLCLHSSLFAGGLVIVAGVWYARSWVLTGNPVYPYFNGWFGGEAHTKNLLRTSHSVLAVPWAVTMHPEEFGGRAVQFGAIFLAILPAAAFLKLPRGAKIVLVIALAYGLIWFVVRQDLRFLLPAAPLLSIAVVAVIERLRISHRSAFVCACVCIAGLLVFQAGIVVKRARPCVAVAFGIESRERFLERNEPSFRTARFANSQLAAGSRVLSQDYRGFYFEPDFVREESLRRRFPYGERGAELVRRLCADGFTHLLLAESENADAMTFDAEFVARLGAAADELPIVWTDRFEGPGGDRRRYRLIELPAEAVARHDEADPGATPRGRMGN